MRRLKPSCTKVRTGSNPVLGTAVEQQLSKTALNGRLRVCTWCAHNGYRDAMSGSVKRRSGGWAFRIDVGTDPATGRRCQVSKQGFATKRAAEQAMAEVVRLRRPPAPRSAPVTWSLGEYLEQWATGKAAHVSPATLRTYRVAIGRVVAALGGIPLSRLSGADVAAWQLQLLHPIDGGRRLSPATVRNTRAVFHKAL